MQDDRELNACVVDPVLFKGQKIVSRGDLLAGSIHLFLAIAFCLRGRSASLPDEEERIARPQSPATVPLPWYRGDGN
jgi:hypothetical protein